MKKKLKKEWNGMAIGMVEKVQFIITDTILLILVYVHARVPHHWPAVELCSNHSLFYQITYNLKNAEICIWWLNYQTIKQSALFSN